MDERRIIWILGSSRSGSTWLLSMLSKLDGVVPMDDPHLGHHLGVWRPIPLAWADDDANPELRTLDEIKRRQPDYFFSDRFRDIWAPALKSLIVARFEAQLETSPAYSGSGGILVVKEPGSQAAELLLSVFPDSRLIFLLRDGRDVVDSWLDGYSNGSWALAEGAFPIRDDGRLAFVRWQSSVWRYRTAAVRAAFERHPAANRVLVRYERLLDDPARELRHICTRFGLRTGGDQMPSIGNANSFERLPPASRGNGRKARSAQPGGWRSNLTLEEQEAMLAVIGPMLAELGYLDAGERERVLRQCSRSNVRAAG